jgi:membrane protein
VILYFGAEFTQAYAIQFGDQIQPAKYAVLIEEVERGKKYKPSGRRTPVQRNQ